MRRVRIPVPARDFHSWGASATGKIVCVPVSARLDTFWHLCQRRVRKENNGVVLELSFVEFVEFGVSPDRF